MQLERWGAVRDAVDPEVAVVADDDCASAVGNRNSLNLVMPEKATGRVKAGQQTAEVEGEALGDGGDPGGGQRRGRGRGGRRPGESLDRASVGANEQAAPCRVVHRAGQRRCRSDVGGAGQIDPEQLLVGTRLGVAVTLVDEERRVAQRGDLTDRTAVQLRVVEHVEVLVRDVGAQPVRHDPQGGDVGRFAGEIGLRQRLLHRAYERLSVGGDRQSFHALVGHPVRQFRRQRPVER